MSWDGGCRIIEHSLYAKTEDNWLNINLVGFEKYVEQYHFVKEIMRCAIISLLKSRYEFNIFKNLIHLPIEGPVLRKMNLKWSFVLKF